MKKPKPIIQPGLSNAQFLARYGGEAQCIKALAEWRWGDGFECPKCGHDRYHDLSYRYLRQCAKCHRQTSVTAGTFLNNTKLPLNTWFLAIYILIQDRARCVTVMDLSRVLGISYNAAWRIRNKLRRERLL